MTACIIQIHFFSLLSQQSWEQTQAKLCLQNGPLQGFTVFGNLKQRIFFTCPACQSATSDSKPCQTDQQYLLFFFVLLAFWESTNTFLQTNLPPAVICTDCFQAISCFGNEQFQASVSGFYKNFYCTSSMCKGLFHFLTWENQSAGEEALSITDLRSRLLHHFFFSWHVLQIIVYSSPALTFVLSVHSPHMQHGSKSTSLARACCHAWHGLCCALVTSWPKALLRFYLGK